MSLLTPYDDRLAMVEPIGYTHFHKAPIHLTLRAAGLFRVQAPTTEHEADMTEAALLLKRAVFPKNRRKRERRDTPAS